MKNLSIQQINEIYKELAYTIMKEKEFLKIVKNITEKEKDPSIIIEKIREYILKIIDKDSNILKILNEIINTKFKNINESLSIIFKIFSLIFSIIIDGSFSFSVIFLTIFKNSFSVIIVYANSLYISFIC